MAPSHYLIQWWVTISGVMMHAPVSNFARSAPKLYLQHTLENYTLLPHLLEANEFTRCSITSDYCHWSYEGHEYMMMKSYWKSFLFSGNVQQSMHIWPHRSGSILWANNIFKAKQSVTQNKPSAYFYHALCGIIMSEEDVWWLTPMSSCGWCGSHNHAIALCLAITQARYCQH